jgi:ParB-like chromosome segregation protein Spo0J
MTLTVEQWPIDRPIPYSRNPRKISDAAVAKVAGSLHEFGWRQPIVVDGEGVVVVGHTRLLAARKLGFQEVPVHVAVDLTPNQAKAYRLADNRVGEESLWNDSLLKLELSDLREMGAELSVLGFDDAELERYAIERDDEGPEDFEEFGEDLDTEHQCPQCGYRFNGGKVARDINADLDDEAA